MGSFQPLFERLLAENQAAEIIYLSSSGQLSHRVFTIRRVTPYYVNGYCQLRKANRSFSFQNILSASPVKTRLSLAGSRKIQ
ncbi:hypothetical protein [Bacillus sp. AK128]